MVTSPLLINICSPHSIIISSHHHSSTPLPDQIITSNRHITSLHHAIDTSITTANQHHIISSLYTTSPPHHIITTTQYHHTPSSPQNIIRTPNRRHSISSLHHIITTSHYCNSTSLTNHIITTQRHHHHIITLSGRIARWLLRMRRLQGRFGAEAAPIYTVHEELDQGVLPMRVG